MRLWARLWGQEREYRTSMSLKQLGLALQSYWDIHVPPATNTVDDDLDSGPGQFPPID